MAGINVVAGTGHAQCTVKGSKFIATVVPAASEEMAQDRLLDIRKKYHDATHNCWAYRIHPEPDKCSDDGEPSGSAGRPMLQVLTGAGVTNVLGVVTRYFGGTKLGVGGLVRAYSDTLKSALAQAPTQVLVPVVRVELPVTFSEAARIYRLADRFAGCRLEKETYRDSGPVFRFRVEQQRYASFGEAVQEALNRTPALSVLEEKLDQV